MDKASEVRPHDFLRTEGNAFANAVETLLDVGYGKRISFESGSIEPMGDNPSKSDFYKVMHIVVLTVLSVFTIIALAIRAAHRASIVQPQIDNIEINNQLKVIQDAISEGNAGPVEHATDRLVKLATTQPQREFIFKSFDAMKFPIDHSTTGIVADDFDAGELEAVGERTLHVGCEVYYTSNDSLTRGVVTGFVDEKVQVQATASQASTVDGGITLEHPINVTASREQLQCDPNNPTIQNSDELTFTANLLRGAFDAENTRLHDEDVAAEVATHIEFIDANDNDEGTAEMTEALRAAYVYVLEHGDDDEQEAALEILNAHLTHTTTRIEELTREQATLAVRPVTMRPTPEETQDPTRAFTTLIGRIVGNPETMERLQEDKLRAAMDFIDANLDHSEKMNVALGVLQDKGIVQAKINAMNERKRQRDVNSENLRIATEKNQHVTELLAIVQE